MQRIPRDKNSLFVTLLMGAFAAFTVLSIVLFPAQAFQASLQGLGVWWKIVFPSLLPFLVISEMMMAYGLSHALGVLTDPLMRLVFRLPGIGGWAVALGYTSGYPAGATIACQLRKFGVVSRSEGERLLILTHVCNPFFLISVVAVGFLHHANLGLILLTIHWLSAMTTAYLIRYLSDEPLHETKQISGNMAGNVAKEYAWIGEYVEKKEKLSLPRRIWFAQRLAITHDGRTFGKIMGDAVSSSLQTLMSIGGYMILFNVLLKMTEITQLPGVFAKIMENVLVPIGMPAEFSRTLLAGLFELHIGAYVVSQAGASSLLWQVCILSVLIAWSGFAHHAQVKSLMLGTDLRYSVFFWAKVLHSIVAGALTFLLWAPLNSLLHLTEPAFALFNQRFAAGTPDAELNLWIIWQDPATAAYLLTGFTIVMVILSAIVLPIQRRRNHS